MPARRGGASPPLPRVSRTASPDAPTPHLSPLPRAQVVNNLKEGVVEPSMSKVKSLRFATEAAITILRIDDFIKISPPQQQQGR